MDCNGLLWHHLLGIYYEYLEGGWFKQAPSNKMPRSVTISNDNWSIMNKAFSKRTVALSPIKTLMRLSTSLHFLPAVLSSEKPHSYVTLPSSQGLHSSEGSWRELWLQTRFSVQQQTQLWGWCFRASVIQMDYKFLSSFLAWFTLFVSLLEASYWNEVHWPEALKRKISWLVTDKLAALRKKYFL